MNTKMYQYGDGSGNTYMISLDSIVYIPITKENSSTGNYSGGEPAKKKIIEKDYQKIQSLIRAIFENKAIHIKDRMKGSGMISIINKQEERQTVIVYKCDEKDQLEDLLINLIKS